MCLISNAFNGSLYLARGTTFRIPYSDKIQYSSVYPKGDTQRQELAPTASRVPLTDKYDCNPMDFILRPMELTLHGMKLWVCKVFGFLPPSGVVGSGQNRDD